MTNDELKKIIEKHEKWLKSQEGGERANLCSADLHGANLCGAILNSAILCGSNLCDADLHKAILCGADLQGANLCNANLSEANLYGAKNVPFIPMACPDSGSFTAWKKAHGHIVKLLIPEDARRSSATGCKCRCDKAFVVAIEDLNGSPVFSWDGVLEYTNTGV